MTTRPTSRSEPFDVVGFVMSYEAAELDDDAIIDGFQHLIDSGQVWSLQGHYGRTATALIEGGYCQAHPRADEGST